MFQMMSKDYFNEIENMMKRIEIIDKQIDELKIEKKEKKNADSVLKKYKHIKELNKIILDEFIDKVYIGEYDKENKTRDIEIEWNFEFWGSSYESRRNALFWYSNRNKKFL